MIGIILALFVAISPASAQPVMIGYLPAFKGLEAQLAAAGIDHYTHIDIAFANPDATGAFVHNGDMSCMGGGTDGDAVTLDQLRAAAVRLSAQGAKILLSVGGGTIPGCSGDWAALLAPGRREAVARALVGVADAAGLDGIDVDLEGELLTRIDREGNYTPFIASLSAALRARGKLLTVATASYQGGMIPAASIPYFDLVSIMSYDEVGPSWGEPGAEHATLAQAERDIALWLDLGVPAERLVLGVPFYGHGFGSFAPGGSFRDLLAAHGDAALTSDVIGAACAGCDYVTFNSPDTLRRKAELARVNAGGVMVWEIGQDTADQLLARTIAAALAAPN